MGSVCAPDAPSAMPSAKKSDAQSTFSTPGVSDETPWSKPELLGASEYDRSFQVICGMIVSSARVDPRHRELDLAAVGAADHAHARVAGPVAGARSPSFPRYVISWLPALPS